MTASLADEALLSTDPSFTQRVRTSIIAAAIAISNDGLTSGLNAQRHVQAANVLISPETWKTYFSAAVATDSTIASQATQAGTVVLTAGNLAAQAALVTDAAINTAVAAVWNSFFSH